MRVVIADDVLLVRAGEAQLLRSVGIEVVAECADADGLLRAVALESPDAAIIDIRMPRPTPTRDWWPPNGSAGCTRAPRCSCSANTWNRRYASRLLADEPAMTGYLLKERVSTSPSSSKPSSGIVAGSCVIDDAIVERLVDRRRGAGGHDPLTDREAEVLELIAAGRSNTAIA